MMTLITSWLFGLMMVFVCSFASENYKVAEKILYIIYFPFYIIALPLMAEKGERITTLKECIKELFS